MAKCFYCREEKPDDGCLFCVSCKEAHSRHKAQLRLRRHGDAKRHGVIIGCGVKVDGRRYSEGDCKALRDGYY